MIITRILRDKSVTLSQLEAKAVERSISLNDLYTALEFVHKDKRIACTTRKGEVHYTVATTPKPTSISHLSWVDNNYPRYDYDMPFPEIDMSHMFLKTKEERDAFKAEAKGMPVYLAKRKYAKK